MNKYARVLSIIIEMSGIFSTVSVQWGELDGVFFCAYSDLLFFLFYFHYLGMSFERRGQK